jgi:prepilin-type N-terminal cleavage/methylation domain-containing protein
MKDRVKSISGISYKHHNSNRKQAAFTIIELLVVIVVIGILAAITIVSYSNITMRAKSAALSYDLNNASKQLEIFKTINGAYPVTINCDIPDSGTNLCIKTSIGASYSYQASMAYGNPSFTLYANLNWSSGVYRITNNTTQQQVGSFKQVVAGFYHACAIDLNDQVECWGYNNQGQLGNNTLANSSIPVVVNNSGVLKGLTIKSIAAGLQHTCVIASDDQVYCWGDGAQGQLGRGSTSDSSVPVAVTKTGALSGLTIKSISAGYYHTCVIASDNQTYCWGDGAQGQLGRGSLSDSSVPVAVDTSDVLSGLSVKYITNGYYHTCVIASNNQAYCWGDNTNGQLGNNSIIDSSIPVAVDTSGVLNGLTIKSISGYYHTCVIASNDQLYCWGDNGQGQLGNNSVTNSLMPVAVVNTGVLNGLTIQSVTTGYYHTCAIASNNQLYCWGDGAKGQLGRNSLSDSRVPVAVLGSGALNGLNIESISGGYYFNCAYASDDNVYCWGDNTYGQLNDNSTIASLVPVETILP